MVLRDSTDVSDEESSRRESVDHHEHRKQPIDDEMYHQRSQHRIFQNYTTKAEKYVNPKPMNAMNGGSLTIVVLEMVLIHALRFVSHRVISLRVNVLRSRLNWDLMLTLEPDSTHFE